MNKAIEQRTVFEAGEDFTITGNITRVSSKGGKIEIFSIPENQQGHEATNQEEVKGIPENQQSHEAINQEEVKGTQEYIEKYFPIAKASNLRLNDKFLRHYPKTAQQRKFKNRLISAIKSGLSDFRAQRMDACFDEDGNICFKAGMKPAVGKLSMQDWKMVAKEFLPEKESRLGTTKERIAFLALLIKYLIEEKGYKVSDAWEEICDQSKDLGHYWDSKNAKHDFEPTGSRQVSEWYDLANTCKITVDDETGDFSFVGGYCNRGGNFYPLVDVDGIRNTDDAYNVSIGWFVLSV